MLLVRGGGGVGGGGLRTYPSGGVAWRLWGRLLLPLSPPAAAAFATAAFSTLFLRVVAGMLLAEVALVEVVVVVVVVVVPGFLMPVGFGIPVVAAVVLAGLLAGGAGL